MALRYVIGLRNLDGVPTTTLGVTVSGVTPTPTTAQRALTIAQRKFIDKGFNVPDTTSLGVVRIRTMNGDVTLD